MLVFPAGQGGQGGCTVNVLNWIERLRCAPAQNAWLQLEKCQPFCSDLRDLAQQEGCLAGLAEGAEGARLSQQFKRIKLASGGARPGNWQVHSRPANVQSREDQWSRSLLEAVEDRGCSRKGVYCNWNAGKVTGSPCREGYRAVQGPSWGSWRGLGKSGTVEGSPRNKHWAVEQILLGPGGVCVRPGGEVPRTPG